MLFSLVLTVHILNTEICWKQSLKQIHKRDFSFAAQHLLFVFLKGSKMKILIFSILALAQICSCRKASQIQAVRNAVLQGYEKDAKPDGKVDVKTGMKVTKFSLCAHKQVCFQPF